ncbi:MAG: hypothetical protein AB1505_05605 [Candidatus Latescibacterota bacterium]
MADLAIYLFGTPPVGDLLERAAALADAGLTVVDWEPEAVDLLPRFGLKAMVHRPTPELARRLAGRPGLWGYFYCDEPYPEDTFPPIGAALRAIREADPAHPVVVNLMSTTGHFLRTFMRVVQPNILSFDYYQWLWGSSRYYEKLEEFRQEALLAGVPLASCVEANANPVSEEGGRARLPDNAVKLRQSVYTNLAYGVTAVLWFSSAQFFEPDSLRLTPSGRDIAALNAELRRLGPVLAGLRSVGVYHTPPLARGTREAPVEHWVHLTGEERRAGLVQGMFEDAAGLDYMLVANRDYHASQSVTVRLQSKWLGLAPWHEPKKPSYGVEQFDRRTGEWRTLTSSSFVGFTFVVGEGDGELFRIRTRLG